MKMQHDVLCPECRAPVKSLIGSTASGFKSRFALLSAEQRAYLNAPRRWRVVQASPEFCGQVCVHVFVDKTRPDSAELAGALSGTEHHAPMHVMRVSTRACVRLCVCVRVRVRAYLCVPTDACMF